jgi:hypothetical protein
MPMTSCFCLRLLASRNATCLQRMSVSPRFESETAALWVASGTLLLQPVILLRGARNRIGHDIAAAYHSR